MHRENVQLLSAARKGDVEARWEVGRRYLLGLNGIQRCVPTGIDYLTHHSVRHRHEASIVIAENLTLEELIQFQQEDALHKAAAAGSVAARLKLGARLCTKPAQVPAGIEWFRMAAASGHPAAEVAARAFAKPAYGSLLATLKAIASCGLVDGLAVALLGAKEALSAQDIRQLTLWLQVALALVPVPTPELSELVVKGVGLAEMLSEAHLDLPAKSVESALEAQARRGDLYAAYTLGRALCGIPCAALAPSNLTSGANVRKGVATLLRAGDAGCDEAWLHLYRLHAAHDTSVSNPHAALLYLEKAALAGKDEAQRKLGALLLRSASSIDEIERGIGLLHSAHMQRDPLAEQLLTTFVLPVPGSDTEALVAVEQLRRHHACLAIRLELSRAFGLTKAEALTVDPIAGIRPWGLVVGPNPFVKQRRLAAPRAVPAVWPTAMQVLKRAVSFFNHAVPPGSEGDFRRRSRVQRIVFERFGLSEAMFFADARSTTLDSLRHGPKWAHRARVQLRAALEPRP